MGRFLRWVWNNRLHGLRRRYALLVRTARLLLIAAGLPLKREYLLLHCRAGSKAIGLFGEFTTVLGALDHYEHWVREYSGLRVDFATQGLYYDAAFGANWWEYYFAPIDVGSSEGAVTSVVNSFWSDHFCFRGRKLSRNRAFEIIDRYIRPKPCISEKLASYVSENFGDHYVIGVHYRGTDKCDEAPRVSYEQIHAAVLHVVKMAQPARHKIFVATDEQAFLDYMLTSFPGVIVYRRMFRSVDGRPTHFRNVNNHDKGGDAVLDCLLLSRCQILIRTASDLSLCSIRVNPTVPEIALNQEW
jgi:hypothetical protein